MTDHPTGDGPFCYGQITWDDAPSPVGRSVVVSDPPPLWFLNRGPPGLRFLDRGPPELEGCGLGTNGTWMPRQGTTGSGYLWTGGRGDHRVIQDASICPISMAALWDNPLPVFIFPSLKICNNKTQPLKAESALPPANSHNPIVTWVSIPLKPSEIVGHMKGVIHCQLGDRGSRRSLLCHSSQSLSSIAREKPPLISGETRVSG